MTAASGTKEKAKMKKVLTDKAIAALKSPAEGRTFVRDVVVPGLMVSVTAKGTKTFLLGARFPGSKDYVRSELGQVGAIGLAEARAQAREWLAAIKSGSDPRRARRADADSFKAVAAWGHSPHQRHPAPRCTGGGAAPPGTGLRSQCPG